MHPCAYCQTWSDDQINCKKHGSIHVTECGACKDFKQKARGLGDTISDGLKTVGITKKRVRKIMGGDCKCNQRRNRLNEMFPYRPEG